MGVIQVSALEWKGRARPTRWRHHGWSGRRIDRRWHDRRVGVRLVAGDGWRQRRAAAGARWAEHWCDRWRARVRCRCRRCAWICGQAAYQRSAQAMVRNATIALACDRCQCMPLPLSRDSTTISFCALPTARANRMARHLKRRILQFVQTLLQVPQSCSDCLDRSQAA